QLAPAGAVELLDTLADSAAVLGRSEATLAEALERLTEGPVRAAVAYVPDVSGQLVPSVSAPVGAGLAGVAPASESWHSLVASEGRPRILAVDGATPVTSGRSDERRVGIGGWARQLPTSAQ